MTIQHLAARQGLTAPAAGPASVEAEYVADAGLVSIIARLIRVLDSVDERLGFLEKRADLARLPIPLDFDPADPADERYFALYSLLPEQDLSETERTPSETERARSEAKRRHGRPH